MNPVTRRIWIATVGGVSLLAASAAIAETPWASSTLSTALAPKDGGKPIRLGVELYGNGWESTITQSRIAGAEIGGELDRTLADGLTASLGLRVQLEAGVARSRFTDEFRPKQVFRLREASLRYSPFSWVSVHAGALDQDRWDAPLLLRRQSYPAVEEQLQAKAGEFTFGLAATQAVVSDTSTLQRWGNWADGLPAFFLERASVEWKKSDRTRVSAHVSHFAFRDLSHAHAYDAQFLGNTAGGFGAETAFFRYAFQGYEAGLSASVELFSGLTPFARVEGARNGSAPDGRGTGWRAEAGLLVEAGDRFRLRPSVELFHVESDAAPAVFNNRLFGHVNRRGWAATLGLELPRSGVRGQVQFVDSRVLVPTPLQADAYWLGFQLSMDYEAI